MSKPSIIRPASELLLPYGINFMLYSDPGVGKTPMLATGEKTLILDADLGAESARHSSADYWPILSWHEMDSVYDYFRHDNPPYRWVWLDGISIGQERLLLGIMEDLVVAKPTRKVWQADKGEYGQNMFRFKQWVQHMVALPINFGITAHPFRWDDLVTGEEMIMPWIQGRNMSPTICGMMNLIGYLTGAYPETKLYTKKHDDYYARDKFGALGAGMVNPTIPKIEAKIMAKLKQEGARPTTAPVRRPVKKVAPPVKKAAPRAVPTGRK